MSLYIDDYVPVVKYNGLNVRGKFSYSGKFSNLEYSTDDMGVSLNIGTETNRPTSIKLVGGNPTYVSEVVFSVSTHDGEQKLMYFNAEAVDFGDIEVNTNNVPTEGKNLVNKAYVDSLIPPPGGAASIQSPNGLNKIDATDTGISITEPGSSITYGNRLLHLSQGNINVSNDDNTKIKLWVGKHIDTGSVANAPLTLGVESQYLVVGGSEYNTNSYRTIGFGYDLNNNIAPISVGYQEIASSGASYGDFIVNTRPSGEIVAPTTVFRVTHDKKILAEDPAYTPTEDNSLANKKYIDDRLSAAQRTAINALTSASTAADIVAALKAA
jgi:hypothetical protein